MERLVEFMERKMRYKDSGERADGFSKDLEKNLLGEVHMTLSYISPPKNAIKSTLSMFAFGVESIWEWEFGGKIKGHAKISLKARAEFLRRHNEKKYRFFLKKLSISSSKAGFGKYFL